MATESHRELFPRWLLFSLLTVAVWGAWGLESKIAVDRVSPAMNQLLFPIGLIPVVIWALRSRRHSLVAGSRRKGAAYGLLTGFLGGVGNIAFYLALSRGGKASVVTPLVGLAPLVTVVLAMVLLNEKLNRSQWMGLVFALASIYLLSA